MEVERSVTRLLRTPGGAPLRSGSTLPRTTGWEDLAAWTHCWNMADAVLYTPSASEQSNFSISATPRVSYVPDLGSGRLPLRRDDTTYGTVYGTPAPLPGPLPIPSSNRFKGKPAVRFDATSFSGPAGNLRAMLSPNSFPTGGTPNTWFNPPNGYAQPYSVACFVRNGGMDATLGSDGTGPTIGRGVGGGFGTLGKWCVACWGLNSISPPTYLNNSHDASVDESTLVIVNVNGASSTMFVTYRDSSGLIQTSGASGTLDPWVYKECFFGWTDGHDYLAFAGIRTGGVFTGTEFANLIAYAGPQIPAPASLATEP